MKVFIPMRDDMLSDPAMAALPLVPFHLDFACQHEWACEPPRSAPAEEEGAEFSDGFPRGRPA